MPETNLIPETNLVETSLGEETNLISQAREAFQVFLVFRALQAFRAREVFQAFHTVPKKPKSPNSPSCTDQQIDCNFLRSTASRLQNEEDDCLRLAAGLDTQGKLRVEPLAQDNNNVVYGITIDGLTSSAWCTDIGWALRRILTTCRRGKTCYGGKPGSFLGSYFG